jgi:hypothetical protein
VIFPRSWGTGKNRVTSQLPQRLLHPLRKHGLTLGRLSDRYVAAHGGSSFDLDRITHHAPSESGRAGGTAVTTKFYEPRDNLTRDNLPARATACSLRANTVLSRSCGWSPERYLAIGPA